MDGYVTKSLKLVIKTPQRTGSKAFENSVPTSDSLENEGILHGAQKINEIESCLNAGTHETAMFIAEKAIVKKWPWMKIEQFEPNILNVKFLVKHEQSFNKLLKAKKIEWAIADCFEDIDSNLQGLIEEDDYLALGAQIEDRMKNVKLDSLDTVIDKTDQEATVTRDLKVTLQKTTKKGKNTKLNSEITRMSEAEIVKDAVNFIGPLGTAAIHVKTCLEMCASATAGTALYVVSKSITGKYPWMKISKVSKGNVLKITVLKKHEQKIDALMHKGKIESNAKDDFTNLEDNLMGIIGENMYDEVGQEILNKLEQVEVLSVARLEPKTAKTRVTERKNANTRGVTKSIKLNLRTNDGQSACLDSSFDIVMHALNSHGTAEEEEIWMEQCTQLDKAAPLAATMYLVGRIITNKWPWMEISNIESGNRLEITVPLEKEENLKKFISEGKIEKLIQEDFKDLQEILPGILHKSTCEKFALKLEKILENIGMESLESWADDDSDGSFTGNKRFGDGNVDIQSRDSINIVKAEPGRRESGNVVANIYSPGGNVRMVEQGSVNIVGNVSAEELREIMRMKESSGHGKKK